MPKTFEQEMLEVESARISADLAYHRERNVVYNKQMFSKKEMDELENRYHIYLWIASLASAFVSGLLMYCICHA